MNGIQFYLRRETPLTRGHVVYLDSPWVVSSVSQAQFWRNDFAATYGDGRAKDCLSAVISDWNTPGVIYGRPARELSAEQVARETWEQMKRSLNNRDGAQLTDDLLLSWHLDPGLHHDGHRFDSDDPLPIPSVGYQQWRTPVATAIPNFVLAGDYVKGDWWVVTMEQANEAGRQAANAILERSGSRETACRVIPHLRPPEWEPLKRIDEQRYRAGLPNLLDLEATAKPFAHKAPAWRRDVGERVTVCPQSACLASGCGRTVRVSQAVSKSYAERNSGEKCCILRSPAMGYG